jgi:hypothetical protein
MKTYYNQGMFWVQDISRRYLSYIHITEELPIKLKKGMLIFAGNEKKDILEVVNIVHSSTDSTSIDGKRLLDVMYE